MKKKIDAVKLVRQIRDENYEKTKKLSRDEEFEDNELLRCKQTEYQFDEIYSFSAPRVGELNHIKIKKRSVEAKRKFLSESKIIEA